MTLWMPKKRPLYAPMLGSLGGGSARGFGRGKSGLAYKPFDIRVNATAGATVAEGGTLTDYQNAVTRGDSSQIVDRYGAGILQFYVKAGTYSGSARSASGNGPQHARYRNVSSFTLTLSQDTPIMVLVPNNGAGGGAYGGGGGFFMVIGEDHTAITQNDVIMVIGGGGGGHQVFDTAQNPGGFQTSHSSASSRRGAGPASYDDGAGLFNTYTPITYDEYNNAATIDPALNSIRPQHFVQGGRGGGPTACGTGYGGLGGGGGSCPGGAGGYVGGYGGPTNPNNFGGGGGTSFYNTTYISNHASSVAGASNVSRVIFDSAESGYLDIS